MTTPFLTEADVQLLTEGTHCRVYEKLGAHVTEQEGTAGTHFAIWAPDAQHVSVIGDFNNWKANRHPMIPRGVSGLWECFVPGVGVGALYKYALTSGEASDQMDRLDPCGFADVVHPRAASRVWDLAGYAWGDQEWLAGRGRFQALDAPIAIYEVHLGSWRRVPEEANRCLTFRETAPLLADYARQLGYTHVEFLPVMEYPLNGSWGYQGLRFFTPSSHFGTPQDFMFLIDTLHRQGLGVILDWLPAHSPREKRGRGNDAFRYSRREVSNFLLSNALFWLELYHIDGLRVDALASMLYLDPSGNEGGGREDPDALAFLRSFNERVQAEYPDIRTIAEESTGWQKVSRSTDVGGLGFRLQWDVGWQHDTLRYLALDPIQRKNQHNRLTFRMSYAFTANFVLPLAHDAVVSGKRSLLSKMPGDDWQKFATLRLLFGFQYAQPGKKLLFMGGELGQWNEWNPVTSLDWHLLDNPLHRGLQRWVRDLNTFYRGEPAFHQLDGDPAGFDWVDATDAERSVLSFLRKGKGAADVLLVVCNFTPVVHNNYRVGVSQKGRWEEVLNSDAMLYGGSGQGNMGGVSTAPVSWHGRTYLLNLTLPPLGMVVFKNSSGTIAS